MSDLTALTISAAAQCLARGEIGPAELTEAYLRRIDALDPALHCYLTVLHDSARTAARMAEARRARRAPLGPLDGIPVALKDNIDVAGVRTTNGMAPRPATVPARDAEIVRRLREAGVVILGKLNLHEGALGGTTDNPHHGRTENPWRKGFTPGGSSGGTGAAVAARLSAGGLGTDTMGSVRLPAAYCGVAGLKPTTGLVSTRGVVPLSWRLDDVGPLARCVADLGLLLDAIAGFDPAHIGSVAAPDPPPARPTKPRRTLGLLANFERVTVHPDVRGAFERAQDVFRRLGWKLERLELPGYDPGTARRAGLLVSEAEGAVVHEAALAASPGAFSPAFRQMLEFGRDAPAARLVKAERMIQVAGFALQRALAVVDFVVAPTAPEPAFAFDEPVPAHQADFTALANFAGCPALTIPCGLSREGLPIGLQLIGPPFEERALLQAAGAFEAALPFPALPELPEPARS